jgi:hypothetical protein
VLKAIQAQQALRVH